MPREVYSQLRPELEQQVGASAYVPVLERPVPVATLTSRQALVLPPGALSSWPLGKGLGTCLCAVAQLASRIHQEEASTCMAVPQQAKTPRAAKCA